MKEKTYLGAGLWDAVLVTAVVSGLAAVVTGVLPLTPARADYVQHVYCDETMPALPLPLPALPADVQPGADPFIVARALEAHVVALEGMVDQLQTALQACTNPTSQNAP